MHETVIEWGGSWALLLVSGLHVAPPATRMLCWRVNYLPIRLG